MARLPQSKAGENSDFHLGTSYSGGVRHGTVIIKQITAFRAMCGGGTGTFGANDAANHD
jgi:hypothetical protein